MSAQPDKDEAANVQGNPISKQPTEQGKASTRPGQSGERVEQRVPQKQTTSSDEATPTASGLGVRGAGPGENESDLSDQAKGRSHVEESEQMGAPGEGAVADAVKGKNSNRSSGRM